MKESSRVDRWKMGIGDGVAVSTEVRTKEKRPLIVQYSSSSDLNGVISSKFKPSTFVLLLNTTLG